MDPAETSRVLQLDDYEANVDAESPSHSRIEIQAMTYHIVWHPSPDDDPPSDGCATASGRPLPPSEDPEGTVAASLVRLLFP
jgi:hypothetical protein